MSDEETLLGEDKDWVWLLLTYLINLLLIFASFVKESTASIDVLRLEHLIFNSSRLETAV